MTTTIKINPEFLTCLNSPTALAIEAVKTGNLPILQMLLNPKIVFKQHARTVLKELNDVEQLQKGIKRFLKMNEAVLEAIKDTEEKAEAKNTSINLDRLKENIRSLLQAEKKQMLKEFKLKHRYLSGEEYARQLEDFQKTLSEEFLLYPWDGYHSVRDMKRAKKRLKADSEDLKSQQKQ